MTQPAGSSSPVGAPPAQVCRAEPGPVSLLHNVVERSFALDRRISWPGAPGRSRTLFAVLAFIAAMTLTSPPAAAQSLNLPRDGDHAIMFERLRPNMESIDSDFLSAAYFLSSRWAVSPRIAVVGELPYARQDGLQNDFYYDGYFGYQYSTAVSGSTIGNPYIGMEARVASGPVFLELGVRPPLASEDEIGAVATGVVSDLTRWDAFLPDVVSIQTAFNVREITPSHVVYRLRLSPVITIPTDGGIYDEDTGGAGDTELFAVYSFLIGYHGSKARFVAGTSGRALLTDDYANLGRRTENQLELHADFLSGSIRPGLDLFLPLGTASNVVPVVLGFNIAWVR